ncbi:MAG: DUF2341 domain-containing protein, partial [Calditrichia bacterium]
MIYGLKGIKSPLIMLFIAAVLFMSASLQAQAWMDPGWDYRMPIEVDNSGNSDALTNYQLKVELDGSNFDFTQAQSGGEDVRFTESDGVTQIDHWIESWDDVGESAVIWVEVPSVAALSSADIYMYFGNALADDGSDGRATFEFFDDFESDYLGSNGWTSLTDVPQIKSDISAASYNGKLYVFGGYNRDEACVRYFLVETYEYDPATDSWTQMADMPTARWGMIAVDFNVLINVFGGESSTGATTVHEIYDPGTVTWAPGTALPATIGQQG